jgi:hypothetical protein
MKAHIRRTRNELIGELQKAEPVIQEAPPESQKPTAEQVVADHKAAQARRQNGSPAPETPAAAAPQPAGAVSVPQPMPTPLPARPAVSTAAALPSGYVSKRGVRDRGQALNVSIPTPLFARLQALSANTGITQKDIVATALEKELALIEFEMQQEAQPKS